MCARYLVEVMVRLQYDTIGYSSVVLPLTIGQAAPKKKINK